MVPAPKTYQDPAYNCRTLAPGPVPVRGCRRTKDNEAGHLEAGAGDGMVALRRSRRGLAHPPRQIYKPDDREEKCLTSALAMNSCFGHRCVFSGLFLPMLLLLIRYPRTATIATSPGGPGEYLCP